MPEDPSTTVAHSFKTLLALFQARSRCLFKQQGSEAMSEYLKPARISKDRLADYGVFSYVPCLRLKLCLEPAAAQAMHEMLLTLRAPGRKGSCKTATLKGFRLPAVPPWAKHTGEPILVQLAYHRHALLVDSVGIRGQLRHEKRARPNVF